MRVMECPLSFSSSKSRRGPSRRAHERTGVLSRCRLPRTFELEHERRASRAREEQRDSRPQPAAGREEHDHEGEENKKESGAGTGEIEAARRRERPGQALQAVRALRLRPLRSGRKSARRRRVGGSTSARRPRWAAAPDEDSRLRRECLLDRRCSCAANVSGTRRCSSPRAGRARHADGPALRPPERRAWRLRRFPEPRRRRRRRRRRRLGCTAATRSGHVVREWSRPEERARARAPVRAQRRPRPRRRRPPRPERHSRDTTPMPASARAAGALTIPAVASSNAVAINLRRSRGGPVPIRFSSRLEALSPDVRVSVFPRFKRQTRRLARSGTGAAEGYAPCGPPYALRKERKEARADQWT